LSAAIVKQATEQLKGHEMVIIIKSGTKKIITKAAILCASLVLVVTFSSVVAAAPEEKGRVEIIEKAKKEGSLMIYTTTTITDFIELKASFEKKYPFLKVNAYQSGTVNLFVRAETEYKAGRNVVDVPMGTLWAAQWWFDAGLLGIYKSPEREAIPEYAKDADGYWTSDYINVGVIAYNTKLVPPDKIPKSYQDLLNPWWKGKVALDDTGFWWYSCMYDILGKDKGRNFLQKLAQQKIRISRGQPLKVQLLAAGELFAIIQAFNNQVELLKKKGAPIDWIAPIDQPTIMVPHTIAIAKNAPHPNAARLYIDFILSKEGQQILASFNRVPTRVDVPPDPARLIYGADGKKLTFLPVDFEKVKKATALNKEFKQLFMNQ